MNRIETEEVYEFVDSVFKFERISLFDCEQVLHSIFERWGGKIGFRKKWPDIIKRFGTKYAHQLINSYSFRTASLELDLNKGLQLELKKGIFQGLSATHEFNSARSLFGFVKHASEFVDSTQACELVDFAIARFEIHIDDEFGDGPWKEWLEASTDMSQNLAGFLWSALASPSSDTRWKACHVIKTLADFNCIQTLDVLIRKIQDENVGAYGSSKFPFYKFHAQQYLLIALLRVSLNQAEILLNHKDIFLRHAHLEPHILIQKISAQIALRIESKWPNTYRSSEVESLEGVGISHLNPIVDVKEDYVESYLHQEGRIGEILA